MKAVEILDDALEGRALVFGSLPPEGRDLDLLLRPTEMRAAEDALRAAGFRNRGEQWVRIEDCAIESVDLVAASDWSLPADELADLFDSAAPLPDRRHLVAPSAHHAILIMARRIQQGARLTGKRRARLDSALADGEHVWDHAAARATAWDAQAGLRRLRGFRTTGGEGTHGRRVKLRRPRVLIALQGMDGSGKSSLSDELARLVRTLGHEPVQVWNRLAVNPSLDIIAVPLKRLMRPLLRRSSSGEMSDGGDPDDPARELRARSTFLTQLWTCFVALWNAASHRRSVQGHLLRGRIVICDRYVLDSAVNLRFRYGTKHRFRSQKWLISAISPKPTRSFHIAVPAAVAHERKPVKFTLSDLEVFERLYEEERPEGVIRLDGTRPREELCTEIGWALWESLG